MPTTYSNVFENAYIEYSTLIVPEEALEAYRSTEPWSAFGTFKTIEGGDEPGVKKCAEPTIAYIDGELVFTTDTEGADVVSEITCEDIKKHYDTHVPLTGTYTITAYATKSGYDDSEKATATLVWATATLSEVTNDVKALYDDATPLLVSQRGGVLNIQGIEAGSAITAYTIDGRQVASVKADGNGATMDLSTMKGNVVVLNVNGKSAKVLVK